MIFNPFAWFKKVNHKELISRLESEDLVEDDVSSYIKEKEELGKKVCEFMGWNIWGKTEPKMCMIPCEPYSCKTISSRLLREIPTDPTVMVNILKFIKDNPERLSLKISILDDFIKTEIFSSNGSQWAIATSLNPDPCLALCLAIVQFAEWERQYEKQEQN